MKLEETNHSYYCSESNYYHNGCMHKYSNWNEFKDEWLDGNLDDDYNHIFRFDIRRLENDDGVYTGGFELMLYMIQQRKGIFLSIWIKSITEEDMPEIEKFLKERWEYLKNQWEEFSK